jgi:hypothetical protein
MQVMDQCYAGIIVCTTLVFTFLCSIQYFGEITLQIQQFPSYKTTPSVLQTNGLIKGVASLEENNSIVF